MVTRLGEGLAHSGLLGEAPMARTLGAIRAYVERSGSLGARDVHIVATSAVREAPNGHDFAAAIEAATGRRVDVVSGETEAWLTLRGGRCGLGARGGGMLTFDICGGGTEGRLGRGRPI